MSKVIIFRGDTFKGRIQVRSRDTLTGIENPFPIELGSTVEIRFPGETSSVVLSTANVGEVSIVDSDLSTIEYEGAPAKSLLLNLGDNQAIDVVVTQGISGEVQTAEKVKTLNVKDRANP